jgi:hypothetical protein
MTPRRGAMLLAVGRTAPGVAAPTAPEQVTFRWLHPENAVWLAS